MRLRDAFAALGLLLSATWGCNQILGNTDAVLEDDADGFAGGGGGGSSDGGAQSTGGLGGEPSGGGTTGNGGGSAGNGGSGGDCDTMGGCDMDCDGALARSCGGDDCSDLEPNVYPGQTQWFEQPTADGSFDYDCSGTEDREFETTECAGTLCSFAQNQFLALDDSEVECGETASFGDCSTVCQPSNLQQKTQRCH